MEEEKAAAYYDELILTGGGAARFKQGLGYGSKPSVLDHGSTGRPISASMSNFVRQLSPDKADLLHKEIRVESIREKLTKREGRKPDTAGRDDDMKRLSRRQKSRSPERGRTKSGSKSDRKVSEWDGSCSSRRRNRSPSTAGRRRNYGRSRSRSTSRELHSRRSASPARARSRHYDHHRRERSKSVDRDEHRRIDGRTSAGRGNLSTSVKRGVSAARDASTTKDYSTLIPNYDNMTPSQRLKAKMRLQLSEAAVNDSAKGMSSDWERFDFDKTAPLDDDVRLAGYEDNAGTADDTVFLKNTGSTFLASSSQARREASIQDAHEAAIFGAAPSVSNNAVKMASTASEIAATTEDKGINIFVSDEVLKMQQQETWQERAKRMREERAAGAAIF